MADAASTISSSSPNHATFEPQRAIRVARRAKWVGTAYFASKYAVIQNDPIEATFSPPAAFCCGLLRQAAEALGVRGVLSCGAVLAPRVLSFTPHLLMAALPGGRPAHDVRRTAAGSRGRSVRLKGS